MPTEAKSVIRTIAGWAAVATVASILIQILVNVFLFGGALASKADRSEVPTIAELQALRSSVTEATAVQDTAVSTLETDFRNHVDSAIAASLKQAEWTGNVNTHLEHIITELSDIKTTLKQGGP